MDTRKYGGAKVHNFSASNKQASEHERSDWHNQLLMVAWPGAQVHRNTNSLDNQHAGTDVFLKIEGRETITIDHKFRENSWNHYGPVADVMLEYMSDAERGVVGWVEKPLTCDFIAYWWVPNRFGLLIKCNMLLGTWAANRECWKQLYGEKPAKNKDRGHTWTTWCVPVPVKVLDEWVEIIRVSRKTRMATEAMRLKKQAEFVAGQWP